MSTFCIIFVCGKKVKYGKKEEKKKQLQIHLDLEMIR